MGDVVADRAVIVTAALAVGAALTAGWTPRAGFVAAIVVGGALTVGARIGPAGARGALVTAGIALLVVASVGVRACQDLAGLGVDLPEALHGTAELGSDPEVSRYGTEVELVVQGRRWDASFDRAVEATLEGLRAGDKVIVDARVRRFRDAPQAWVRSRHLAGRLDVSHAQRAGVTAPWYRAANAVHEMLERGSASMEPAHRSLYLGLVVGDDRGQSPITRFRFEAAGLTHLLAVSGQNLVFVLALLAPLIRRVTQRHRFVIGAAAIGCFVLVTRAEPSVLRAGVMALLGLFASLTGRRVSGLRTIGLAVILLLLGDPMLVHSVGFRLSVAATTGLVLFTRPLEDRLIGPPWLRLPMAVTLAAQAGAAPVMVLTFGPMSVVAIPANLLAEPAAAAVMMLGMSTGLLSGLIREELAWLLQAPVRVAVWWVDTVATTASKLSVPPLGGPAWAFLLVGVGWALHLWRSRGPRVVGRALCAALIPMLLVLRPPVPSHVGGGAVVADGAATLEARCGTWMLRVGASSPPGSGGGTGAISDERAAAAVIEDLWRRGITRVAVVAVPVDHLPAGAGPLADLAAQLRADVVGVDPTGPVEVRRPEGESPCDATT